MQTARPRSHPFRHRLSGAATVPATAREESDLKLFAVSFTAFFLCFYTFLL